MKKKEKQSKQAKHAALIVQQQRDKESKVGPGQPTSYSTELAEEICNRLSEGELLKNICLEPHMPSRRTVLNWTHTHEEFFLLYARARAAQSDFWAEQCIELSDEAYDGESSSAQRLKVDTRKWIAAKLRPRMWGDHGTGFDRAEKPGGQSSTKRLIENLRRSRAKRSGGSSGSDSGSGGT